MMEPATLIYNTARSGSPVNPGLPDSLARLVVAQARHETNNFTSNFFTNYNNAFGYSYVSGARYQSGAGTIADNGLRIAAYASLRDSVYEIIDWLYRRQKEGKFPSLDTIKTPDQYAALLKSANYYGDSLSNYASGLRRWVAENPKKSFFFGAIFLISVVIILQKS